MKYQVIMRNLKTRRQLEQACRLLEESDKGARVDLVDRIFQHSHAEIKVTLEIATKLNDYGN